MFKTLIDSARNEANKCFDEHCKAWNTLNIIEEPTLNDLEKWLSVRDNYYAKQEYFESLLRKSFFSLPCFTW